MFEPTTVVLGCRHFVCGVRWVFSHFTTWCRDSHFNGRRENCVEARSALISYVSRALREELLSSLVALLITTYGCAVVLSRIWTMLSFFFCTCRWRRIGQNRSKCQHDEFRDRRADTVPRLQWCVENNSQISFVLRESYRHRGQIPIGAHQW